MFLPAAATVKGLATFPPLHLLPPWCFPLQPFVGMVCFLLLGICEILKLLPSHSHSLPHHWSHPTFDDCNISVGSSCISQETQFIPASLRVCSGVLLRISLAFQPMPANSTIGIFQTMIEDITWEILFYVSSTVACTWTVGWRLIYFVSNISLYLVFCNLHKNPWL